MLDMTPTTNLPEQVSLSRISEPVALRHVGLILSGAFEFDPVLQLAIPNDGLRAKVMPLLYECIAQVAMVIGGVELSWRRSGALWLESRMDAPVLLALRVGFLRVLWRIGPRAFLRLMRHEHYCADRARKVGPRRYGYLWVLGVSPDSQGQGWGVAAISQAMQALRKRGHQVCLLKTETERNVTFYEKLGFSCIDTSVVPSSGIRYWLMQKDLKLELS
jgi:ribosomal protein S18 acetylase RimI-like enzyme